MEPVVFLPGMKKLLVFLAALLILLLAAIYIFIPGKIIVSRNIKIEANSQALFRKFSERNQWHEWWPSKESTGDSIYQLDGINYVPGNMTAVSAPVSIRSSNINAETEITIIRQSSDTTILVMKTAINSSWNPLKRISAYLDAKKLASGFSSILESVNKTYSKIPALYGYDIQKKLVVDSNLLFTSAEVKGKPDYKLIYSLIDKLKEYIRNNDAKETGYPMLHMLTEDSLNYLVKVAIPVDRRLPDSGNIKYKWMLGGGNILITEVKGGPEEINKAYIQIRNYISDYKRVEPAIPFESLVTDRRTETDSSKWITRIYYPVM